MISQNNQIALIKKIEKEYHIVIVFKLDLTRITRTDTWYNVVHLTTGGKDGEFGNRQPAIFIKKSSVGRVSYQVISAVSNEYSSIYQDSVDTSLFDDWVTIDICQTISSDGEYVYKVVVNDAEVVYKTNSNPREFADVIVYAKSGWTPAFEGGLVRINFINGMGRILKPFFIKMHSS